MIPKTIHYCWFGGKPLSKLAQRCIASWRRMLPEYEVREWNESNFDVEIIPYTKEAYALGKYAFVSDYARYRVLYSHGGLYFDTDVEIVKPLNDIVEAGPFFGIENSGGSVSVNPGVGMGGYAGMEFYKRIMDIFERLTDGVEPLLVKETTGLLSRMGFSGRDEIQRVGAFIIYPNEYFNPKDDYTGRIRLTDSTRSIHYYSKSWVANYGPLRNKLTQLYHRIVGCRNIGNH